MDTDRLGIRQLTDRETRALALDVAQRMPVVGKGVESVPEVWPLLPECRTLADMVTNATLVEALRLKARCSSEWMAAAGATGSSAVAVSAATVISLIDALRAMVEAFDTAGHRFRERDAAWRDARDLLAAMEGR